MPKVLIRSAAKSFWRAGIQFTHAGVEVDTDELSKEQLAAIEAEPELSVIDADDADDGNSSAPAKKAAAKKAATKKAASK